MAQHDIIERFEELNREYTNAIHDGNYALADQIDQEINYLMEDNDEED